MGTISAVSPRGWGPRIRGPHGDGVNNRGGHRGVHFEICCSFSPSTLWRKCSLETVVIKEKAALFLLLQTAVNFSITTDSWSVLCRLWCVSWPSIMWIKWRWWVFGDTSHEDGCQSHYPCRPLVWSRSRSSEMAPFDRPHTIFYLWPCLISFQNKARCWSVENSDFSYTHST